MVLVGAAGALISGLAAKLRDTGFADERLNQIGASLKPGTSAIIAVIEHKWVAEVEQILAEEATDIMVRELSADIAQQLEAGREVAYTALSMQDAYSAGRMSVGEDSVEISGLTVTEEGLVAVDAVLEAVDETEALPAGEDAEQA